MLKILFIGDVSGRPGRELLRDVLPKIKRQYKPDLIVANVENSAGGFGVSRETVSELVSYGVDVCTSGDHTFALKEFWSDPIEDLPFIRPANYDVPHLPGAGYTVVDVPKKGRVAIINLLGQELFTQTQKVRNPFWFIDELLRVPEIAQADVRCIDFHAEATSEKLSLAWYVRERVHTLVGTHTHVATADNRLLDGKIAYVTDVGQVGPYAASLWVDFDAVIHNFKYPHRLPFKIAEAGPRVFNSVLVSYKSKQAKDKNYSPISIERIDVVVE